MPGHWDDSLKIFISENPQDFASWLLGEAQVKVKLLTEFKTRTIEADALLEVTLNEEDMLLHIEFQSTNDPAIGERLLGYNFEAKREHKLPVHSCVIYLKNVGIVPEPPLRWKLPNGREVLQFHYESVELGRLSTESLRRTGLTGLLPLLILTKDGATREVVEEVISGLQVAEKNELLPITQLLASLVFTSELDKEWIIWRFDKMSDILRETWAYQEIMQEGEIRGLYQAVQDVIQERFPEILPYTIKQLEGIQDAEILRHLIVKMSTVRTAEEAFQYLFTIGKEEKKN
jgi:predicted transposase/invertase (TIGR01784 family)